MGIACIALANDALLRSANLSWPAGFLYRNEEFDKEYPDHLHLPSDDLKIKKRQFVKENSARIMQDIVFS